MSVFTAAATTHLEIEIVFIVSFLFCGLGRRQKIRLGRRLPISYSNAVQATVDIDARLLREAEELARRKGQPLGLFVEQALRDSLNAARQQQSAAPELYGEPLSDEDITDSARVTFNLLDEDEKRSQTR
jgi:hypothetical protein